MFPSELSFDPLLTRILTRQLLGYFATFDLLKRGAWGEGVAGALSAPQPTTLEPIVVARRARRQTKSLDEAHLMGS